MLPHEHLLLGMVFGLLLYPYIGANSILFILASVLIDIDHYPYHAVRMKDWNFFRIYRYGVTHVGNEIFAFFHTMEFLALLYFVSLFFKPLFFVFLGVLFHDVADLVHHYFVFRKYRNPGVIARKFFLLYNIILLLSKPSL